MPARAVGCLLLLTGCSYVAQIGAAIDDVCVVGKLSAADALYLNAQHQKWTSPAAKAGDRVVNGDCSDLSHAVTQGSTAP